VQSACETYCLSREFLSEFMNARPVVVVPSGVSSGVAYVVMSVSHGSGIAQL